MAPRRFQRALWIASGIASLCVPPISWGQKYDPTMLPAPASSNVGCDAGCQPRSTSYGYYLENWRRWPEEPSTPSITPKLSPYAVIPRATNAPKSEIPDSRDEVAPRQRHAPSTGAAPAVPSSPAASPSPAATQTSPPPPAAQPAPSEATDVAPPSELPNAPSAELPSDEPSPAGDELPSADALPADSGLPSDDEPMFPTPTEEDLSPLPDAAAPEGEDELLDGLPDLDSESRRLQRYQNERAGHYRRADDERTVSQARRKPAPAKRAVAASRVSSRPKRAASHAVAASPVAYRAPAPAGRRNPLRPQAEPTAAAPRPHRSARTEMAPRDVVPVEFIEEEAGEEYLEAERGFSEEEVLEHGDEMTSDVSFSDDEDSEPQAQSPRSSASAPSQGRSNPLRNNSL